MTSLRHDISCMLKNITINKAKDKKLDGGIPQQTGVRKRKADGWCNRLTWAKTISKIVEKSRQWERLYWQPEYYIRTRVRDGQREERSNGGERRENAPWLLPCYNLMKRMNEQQRPLLWVIRRSCRNISVNKLFHLISPHKLYFTWVMSWRLNDVFLYYK